MKEKPVKYRLTISLLAAAIFVLAQTPETTPPATPPALTAEQKAAIYKAAFQRASIEAQILAVRQQKMAEMQQEIAALQQQLAEVRKLEQASMTPVQEHLKDFELTPDLDLKRRETKKQPGPPATAPAKQDPAK